MAVRVFKTAAVHEASKLKLTPMVLCSYIHRKGAFLFLEEPRDPPLFGIRSTKSVAPRFAIRLSGAPTSTPNPLACVFPQTYRLRNTGLNDLLRSDNSYTSALAALRDFCRTMRPAPTRS
jgi:hypothetical protein